jgi:DNA invertase Pin-like site-specific DNA recombinase
MHGKQKVIGYLRVSTLEQDLEKNEADILKFANTKDLGKVDFISEKVSGMKSWKTRKLAEVVQNFKQNDVLIVTELSRLGRSLIEVLEVLNELSKKDVKVYSVKENFQLNGGDIQSKVMRTMLALFAEIERDLIIARTKEGLQLARSKGKILGRPRGKGKSRLDQYREEITTLLQNGSTKKFISHKYGVTSAALLNWIKKNN